VVRRAALHRAASSLHIRGVADQKIDRSAQEKRSMAITKQQITPCLWFDTEGEDAAKFYTGIFKNSRITRLTRYGKAGQEITGGTPGSVMLVEFELDGQRFTALNGGPHFKFNEAVSFQIECEDQGEIDYYWEKLGAGGDPKAQVCGWLKDKFGLSWQVVPDMSEFFNRDESSPASERAMEAMLKMKKIDIAELRRAAEGTTAAV
jgi:predicted 3-demethylubiquinone-9 3-methyltransferase (glyoxalase superfamily)